MFKRLITVGIAGLLGSAAHANLITNGSFESGLTGWTAGGTQLIYPPAVVVTDGASGCCFGEAVPADTVVGGSDEAAGTHGVYFVDDGANQTLSQTLALAAGAYEIGFDAYAPQNGFNNPFDASFNGTIANIVLADYTVHGQNAPKQWLHYSGIANVLAAGNYDVLFRYVTPGTGAAADVVIDRVYVLASTQGGGTPIGPSPVPEPTTLALLAAGLLGFGAVRRNKRS
ncbi:MAG TPA: PEP-CTERM sorting domain-containing protein [Gammaproteobacteria bacterium]|nr:PEP-CTERM sorting domain-containing protein [Gammaproteobacteria bacterium]